MKTNENKDDDEQNISNRVRTIGGGASSCISFSIIRGGGVRGCSITRSTISCA